MESKGTSKSKRFDLTPAIDFQINKGARALVIQFLPRSSTRRPAVNRGLSQLYGGPAIPDIHLKWFAAAGSSPDLMRAAVYVFGTFPE